MPRWTDLPGGMNVFGAEPFLFYSDAFNKKSQAEPEPETIKIPKPKEIKDFLDQYVIGQDEAKRVLSVAVHNHYVRIASLNDDPDEIEIQKSNILMMGNSGSGKTLLAKTVAKFLDVPFVAVDITSFTPTGIVGDSIEDIATKLIDAAGGDKKKAERGIVFLDEIDKLANNDTNGVKVKGVLGGATQSSLLKLLEGDYLCKSSEGPFSAGVKLCIKNVLFICGGAFDGIENLVKKEEITKHIGFMAENSTLADTSNDDNLECVTTEEIVKYGIMPEVLGRLPIFLKLKPLRQEDLRQILVAPKNAIVKQYQRLLSKDDIELEFSDSALDEIAKLAVERKIGARGLRSIVEKVMTDVIFDMPYDGVRHQYQITSDMVISHV